MKIVFLGTGTSHGIPVIGCHCRVCKSADTRNRRNRLGLWLHDEKRSVVIDVSGDFRQGALRHGLERLDGALLTHSHADHIAGLDDLRIFSQRSGQAVSVYGSPDTLREVRDRFAYAFAPPKNYGGGVPQYDLIPVSEPFDVAGWKVIPLPILHGPEPILGFRVGDFALVTDVTVVPDSTLALMGNLDVLVLDCLWDKPHTTHLSFDGALNYARRIGAKRTYFIHMAHDLDHADTEARLPPEIRLSYDGLEIEVEG